MFVIIVRAGDLLAGAARRQSRSEQLAVRPVSGLVFHGALRARSTSSATAAVRSCRLLTLFATIIVPTLLIVLLVALPFIDRNPARRLSRRPWVLGLTALTMVGAIGLSFFGQNNVVKGQLAHHLIGPERARDGAAQRRAAEAGTGRNRRQRTSRNATPAARRRPPPARARACTPRTAPAVTARPGRACRARSRRSPATPFVTGDQEEGRSASCSTG